MYYIALYTIGHVHDLGVLTEYKLARDTNSSEYVLLLTMRGSTLVVRI